MTPHPQKEIPVTRKPIASVLLSLAAAAAAGHDSNVCEYDSSHSHTPEQARTATAAGCDTTAENPCHRHVAPPPSPTPAQAQPPSGRSEGVRVLSVDSNGVLEVEGGWRLSCDRPRIDVFSRDRLHRIAVAAAASGRPVTLSTTGCRVDHITLHGDAP